MPFAPRLSIHAVAFSVMVLAGAFLLRSEAAAQPMGEVVIVPFGGAELNDGIAASGMLEAALSDAQVPVISLHDARDRFTARSRTPQLASDSDVDVLAREARDAIEHVAFGRT